MAAGVGGHCSAERLYEREAVMREAESQAAGLRATLAGIARCGTRRLPAGSSNNRAERTDAATL